TPRQRVLHRELRAAGDAAREEREGVGNGGTPVRIAWLGLGFGRGSGFPGETAGNGSGSGNVDWAGNASGNVHGDGNGVLGRARARVGVRVRVREPPRERPRPQFSRSSPTRVGGRGGAASRVERKGGGGAPAHARSSRVEGPGGRAAPGGRIRAWGGEWGSRGGRVVRHNVTLDCHRAASPTKRSHIDPFVDLAPRSAPAVTLCRVAAPHRERPHPQFTRSSPTRVAGQGWGGLPGGRAGRKGRPRPRPQS